MSDKLIFRVIFILSFVVLGAVIVLNQKVLPRPEPTPGFVYYLPMLNAFINGTCFVLLLISLLLIRRKNIAAHKRVNLTAFFLSALFLVSYITYHWIIPQETRYPSGNPMKYLYYVVLISHIVLAAIVLPMVLISFYRGLQMNVEKHRRIVRWSFPIWLYVTLSGVVVYLMISPYYNF